MIRTEIVSIRIIENLFEFHYIGDLLGNIFDTVHLLLLKLNNYLVLKKASINVPSLDVILT